MFLVEYFLNVYHTRNLIGFSKLPLILKSERNCGLESDFSFFLPASSTPSDIQCGNRCNLFENKFRLIIFRSDLPGLVKYPILQTDLKSNKNCAL